VAEGEGALLEAAKKAFAYGDRILVEEYISGRELTVGVLGDRALPVVEIVTRSGIYDYEAKYKDPETKYLVPAPIDDKAASSAGRLGLLSHKSLGCRSFSRVDMMMDSSGNIFVLEVNTIPGMTERSLLPKAAKAAGINFTDLCVKLLEDAVSASRSRVRA
jgi:D-alanine--D-alanine ligase